MICIDWVDFIFYIMNFIKFRSIFWHLVVFIFLYVLCILIFFWTKMNYPTFLYVLLSKYIELETINKNLEGYKPKGKIEKQTPTDLKQKGIRFLWKYVLQLDNKANQWTWQMGCCHLYLLCHFVGARYQNENKLIYFVCISYSFNWWV